MRRRAPGGECTHVNARGWQSQTASAGVTSPSWARRASHTRDNIRRDRRERIAILRGGCNRAIHSPAHKTIVEENDDLRSHRMSNGVALNREFRAYALKSIDIRIVTHNCKSDRACDYLRNRARLDVWRWKILVVAVDVVHCGNRFTGAVVSSILTVVYCYAYLVYRATGLVHRVYRAIRGLESISGKIAISASYRD